MATTKITTREQLKAVMTEIMAELVVPKPKSGDSIPIAPTPNVVAAAGGQAAVWVRGAINSRAIQWGLILGILIPMWPAIEAFLEKQLLSSPFSPETKVVLAWVLGFVVFGVQLYIRHITDRTITQRGLAVLAKK